MGTTASDIAEFYYQLALLVRARLPLPESLRKLSEHFPQRGFRDTLLRIGERSEQGETFSDILSEHPEYFSAFHVRLLALGEQSGALAEMLGVAARLARFQQLMVINLRNVLAYPMLTVHVACIGVMILGIFVLPRLEAMLLDLYAEEGMMSAAMPPITRFVMGVAGVISAAAPVVIVLYLIFLGYTIWLFLPGRASHRAALWLIDRLPGSWRVLESLENSRICTMWGIFLERGVPMADAMGMVAGLLDRPALRAAMERAQSAVRDGRDVSEALFEEPAVHRMIGLTLQHSPEAQVPEDLQGLGELFDHRFAAAAQGAAALWSVFAFILMVLMVSAVGIALYLPIVEFFHAMTSLMG